MTENTLFQNISNHQSERRSSAKKVKNTVSHYAGKKTTVDFNMVHA
jgi:hypothetical protein